MTMYVTTEDYEATGLMVPAEVGDHIEQHETTCTLQPGCTCTVLRYTLTDEGWQED